MAKKKKRKQEQISEELIFLLISIGCLLLLIISAFKWGLIGRFLDYIFTYLFGYLNYLIYLLLFILFIYMIIKREVPSLSRYHMIGGILIFMGILIAMNFMNMDTGIKAIQNYLKNAPLNRSGFIGVLIYGLMSALIDYWGSMLVSVACFVVGFLILNEFSLKPKKKTKPKNKDEFFEKVEKPKEKSSYFNNYFKKKSDRNVLFDERVFEDEEIVFDDIEKEEPVQSFTYNEAKQKIDIIDNSVKEEEKEDLPEEKPVKENSEYRLPSLSLLNNTVNKKQGENKNHAVDNAERLTAVLNEFGVHASITNILIGPSITKYELKLETGTRVNKIMSLQDDIKLALAAKDIRIEAPIPGKPAVGVEIPNLISTTVSFKEVFKKIPVGLKQNKLLVPLGKDVNGEVIYAELNKMPHLLIAGATGSGKSVCINTIICSILMRAKPDEVKMILVDPKKVELSNYNGIPHLLAPVVTDPKKAAATLREVVSEMERRYDLFASANVRKIESYNEYVKKQNENNESKIEKLPYIVIVLDEVADLMMVASKDVEDCIMRIAQLARAAGIHLIVATQRPSTDIITGVIKANIPSRIAFAVSSSIDSRTILDCTGAEKLLGKGDMLFLPMGQNAPIRVQGAFVEDKEVEAITHHVCTQQEANYSEKYVNVKPVSGDNVSKEEQEDEEYEMCRAFVIKAQKASTSLLQRQFRIGYNKAARIIDQLEDNGVIGPQVGSKPREVYIQSYEDEI